MARPIILTRFIPIIRTFAPFVAGIGKMTYRRFLSFNAIDAVMWVMTFLLGGFYFGNVEVVKKNFTIVIMAIVVISVLPAVIEVILARRRPHEVQTKEPVGVE